MEQRARKRGSGRKAITGAKGLIETGLVPAEHGETIQAVEASFSVRLTPHIIDQLSGARNDDPVFVQYIPDGRELSFKADDMEDPIGDAVYEKAKGVTHRYPDRVLLKPTHTCMVYCRFCFRREKVGHPEEALNRGAMDDALSYIRKTESIWEVILSGGDPLVLSDRRLEALMEALGTIDHVAVIRMHTRAPLADPKRITADLVEALRKSGKAVHFVIHVNHANELTPDVLGGLAKLVNNGVPLFSQTVLLKGVNDDADTLADLFRKLVANRVKPYYLHQLDKARGVGHFHVSIRRGQQIMRALRGRVSGLCQPAYVLDIPGGHGKVPIGPTYLSENDDGSFTVTDYCGQPHHYEEIAADQD